MKELQDLILAVETAVDYLNGVEGSDIEIQNAQEAATELEQAMRVYKDALK